jgi:hypothetical protein
MIKIDELRTISEEAKRKKEEAIQKALETYSTSIIEPELVKTAKLGCTAHTFKKELFKGVASTTLINYLHQLGFEIRDREYEFTVSW